MTRALSHLEAHLGKPAREVFKLTAGTVDRIDHFGCDRRRPHRQSRCMSCTSLSATSSFRRRCAASFGCFSKYRYPHGPLEEALKKHVSTGVMGDFWGENPIDVVITVFDLVDNRTRFVKPWKPEYAHWPIVKAVLASSSVPTFFPAVEDRYVDGGVGSYANPCYIAAFEAKHVLGWDPEGNDAAEPRARGAIPTAWNLARPTSCGRGSGSIR